MYLVGFDSTTFLNASSLEILHNQPRLIYIMSVLFRDFVHNTL